MNNLFPIHHTRAGRFPPIYRPALFFICFLWGFFFWFTSVGFASDDLIQSNSIYSDKISTLRAKSSAHSRYVSELLAELGETTQTPVIPPEKAVSKSYAQSEYDSNSAQPDFTDSKTVQLETPKLDHGDGGLAEGKQSPDPASSDDWQVSSRDEIGRELYASLYESDTELRGTGVYVGPFSGISFSSDSAVRNNSDHTEYTSESGYFFGFRLGNDFGPTKLEVDYSFKSHDIESGNSTGDVLVNSFMGRFIIEKGVGDRFDFRTGLGMGLAMVEKNLNKTYKGNGFCYDFLVGFSVRIMENWSLLGDYRYYLTAANKNYDRVQSHLFEISANFDL